MSAKQPGLFDLHQQPSPGQPVEYLPPTPDDIKEYAAAVAHLFQCQSNSGAICGDFEQGFRDFVTVITRIHARYLSDGETHDTQKITTRSDAA